MRKYDKENIVETVIALSRSLTEEQHKMLDRIAQACKESGEMTPLMAVIMHSDRKLSEKEIEWVAKIVEEDRDAGRHGSAKNG